jgi:hypothetical protein
MATDGDAEAVAQRLTSKTNRSSPETRSTPTVPEQQAEPDHRKALFPGAFADTENQDKAEKQQGGLSRRVQTARRHWRFAGRERQCRSLRRCRRKKIRTH